MAEKRTPMAWQHRDMNYHQAAYQDRYGPGLDMQASRPGPPSTSDRLSHRTDKSWRTRESHAPSTSAYQGPVQGPYIPSVPYPNERPISRQQTPGSSTGTSSSSSGDDSEEEIHRNARGHPVVQPAYGYSGYYPGYVQNAVGPAYPPSGTPGYPGTMKSSKSVPAMAMQGTWDGEPCPVHGLTLGPMSLPMDHPAMHPMGPPGHPQMMPVGPASMPPVPMVAPRRAASIYDMRMINTPPGAIYGTLPARPHMLPGDRRSLAGMPSHGPPQGIPPQLLPPMVRPRPLVVSEDGTAEPLPVRSPHEKSGTLNGHAAKMAEVDSMKKRRICARGGSCVAWVIVSLILGGILVGLLVVFIL